MTGQTLVEATAEQVTAARTAADALGLYFKLANPARDPAGWRPAALLYEQETGPLDELLDSIRERLGGCERRVAASLLYQGYAARLLSPQLACLAIDSCIPATPPDALSWRAPATEMIELALPTRPGWQGPPEPLLDQLLVQSFTAHLHPLATALQTRVRISAALLQDNAASALISGLRLLSPQLAESWPHLAASALANPTLHGSGTLQPTERSFTRRSCCLYYRTPAGGLCGDCPLSAMP